jgi:hypothetical protein
VTNKQKNRQIDGQMGVQCTNRYVDR